jgi:maleylpyruvate isomerase
MAVALADALGWVRSGTELFLTALASRSDEDLDAPTALPGWTGRHVTAHVCANADALRNLVHWARTGEERPMYSSRQQRSADIEAGARRPAAQLRHWARTAAAGLEEDFRSLDRQQWCREVRTAQGRTVPATEIPWMRSREVMVHAVDLGAGTGFADLPGGFLTALVDDIIGTRTVDATGPSVTLTATDTGGTWSLPGPGSPTEVSGTLADLTAYLAGRAHAARTGDGTPAPLLSRWL